MAACRFPQPRSTALTRRILDPRTSLHRILQSLGLEYFVSVGVFILVCGVAAMTRNVKFHTLFVLGAVVYEISFFARFYNTLN